MWAKIIDNTTATPVTYEFPESKLKNCEYRLMADGALNLIIVAEAYVFSPTLEDLTNDFNGKDLDLELYNGTTLIKSFKGRLDGYTLESVSGTMVERLELSKI